MYFTSNGFMEVFVRYLSISVIVKFIEDVLELLFSQIQTPMVQVELKFFWFNGAALLFVQVNECFSDCLPLDLNLVNDCSLKVLIH
jgi:hypothetical protein